MPPLELDHRKVFEIDGLDRKERRGGTKRFHHAECPLLAQISLLDESSDLPLAHPSDERVGRNLVDDGPRTESLSFECRKKHLLVFLDVPGSRNLHPHLVVEPLGELQRHLRSQRVPLRPPALQFFQKALPLFRTLLPPDFGRGQILVLLGELRAGSLIFRSLLFLLDAFV